MKRPASLVLLAAACSAAFFALAVTRACRTLCVLGDSAELTTAAAVWGVPHAPGYPLYVAIAHAFTCLPFGELPFRVHLTSAVFHAVAVGAVVVGTALVTSSAVAAVAAGVALAGSRLFLLGSLYAEVFPLNDAFTALLFAGALRLHLAHSPPRPAQLALFSAGLGLAAAHHPMIELAAPSLAILLAWPVGAAFRESPGRVAFVVAPGMLAYLASYALVPIVASRAPHLSWGDVRDAGSLARLMLRADYGGPLSAARHTVSGHGLGRVGALMELLVTSAGVPVVALAGAGLVALRSRAPAIAASLAVALLTTGPVFAWANALAIDTEATRAYFARFFSMCHVPLAIACGVGVSWATDFARPWPRRLRATSGALLALAAFDSAASRTRDVDLRDDRRGLAYAHDLIATPPHALVLMAGDAPAAAADYACAVEDACGDRTVFAPGLLSMPWRMRQVRSRFPDVVLPWTSGPALPRVHEIVAAAIGARPVLVHPTLVAADPAIRRLFRVEPEGLLLRVWPRDVADGVADAPLRASADRLGAGACEGCRLPLQIAARPSQEVQVVQAYEAAYRNHAVALAGTVDASALVVALDGRASGMAALVQGGGSSISR